MFILIRISSIEWNLITVQLFHYSSVTFITILDTENGETDSNSSAVISIVQIFWPRLTSGFLGLLGQRRISLPITTTELILSKVWTCSETSSHWQLRSCGGGLVLGQPTNPEAEILHWTQVLTFCFSHFTISLWLLILILFLKFFKLQLVVLLLYLYYCYFIPFTCLVIVIIGSLLLHLLLDIIVVMFLKFVCYVCFVNSLLNLHSLFDIWYVSIVFVIGVP